MQLVPKGFLASLENTFDLRVYGLKKKTHIRIQKPPNIF